MRALVLGASGFLGNNLVRALLEQGEQVRVFLRPGRVVRNLDGLEVERVEGDLAYPDTLKRACEGVGTVYHAAGFYPAQTVPVEVACSRALSETRHVLSACERGGVERLVFTSSLTTIGPPQQSGSLANETCTFRTAYPKNPYLMAKVVMEQAVLEAAPRVPTVVVNPTVCFGPYDSRPSSGMQVVMIARRQMPAYVDGPVNVIDVRDVAVGHLAAAQRGRIGERYILGNWNTSQRELNRLIARRAGVPPPLVALPFPLARLGGMLGDWLFRVVLRRPAPVPGFFVEVLRHMQHYDCRKGIEELQYPRHPVDQAIDDAIAWFRAHGYLPRDGRSGAAIDPSAPPSR